MTIKDLKCLIQDQIKKIKGYSPDKYDTLGIYFSQHGSKTSNLIINLSVEFLKDDLCLSEAGIQNETELSFFNLQEFETFKKDPQVKW
jgi:hypothetical protein